MGPDHQHKLVLCLFAAFIWYQIRYRSNPEPLLLERFEVLLFAIALSQLTIEGLVERAQVCVNNLRTFKQYINLLLRQLRSG